MVPSQVLQNRGCRNGRTAAFQNRPRVASGNSCLIPSQVLRAHPNAAEEGRGVSSSKNDTKHASNESSVQGSRNIPRTPQPKPSNNARIPQANTESIEGPSSRHRRTRQRNRRKALTGNAPKPGPGVRSRGRRKKIQTGDVPDVLWRSIPLEHLRHHPQFRPLPLPETIGRLECMEDVRYFRQESWQWDVLHEGRCTTSQAVAAMGFLEPKAAERLGVPKGLRRGGLGAYHRLCRPALRSLDEMNARLCVSNDGGRNGPHVADPRARNRPGVPERHGSAHVDNPYWTQPAGFPFAANYMVAPSEYDRQVRREETEAYLQSRPGMEWSIRMMWGNTQEATAVLTALNYFWKLDSNVTLEEVGMCGAGLEFNRTSSTDTVPGLIVGATPDALLRHPDGRVEALEVKNHCPFIPNVFPQDGSDDSSFDGKHRFRIGWQDFGTKSVLPNYIPQLMMEMLCVGEECRSAVMVRQTATMGSLVMRIHRDDAWVEEMLYWLSRFYSDFVTPEEPPRPNFFLDSSNSADRSRYLRFLDWTKRIESQVELLCHISNEELQRACGASPESTNYFLD